MGAYIRPSVSELKELESMIDKCLEKHKLQPASSIGNQEAGMTDEKAEPLSDNDRLKDAIEDCLRCCNAGCNLDAWRAFEKDLPKLILVANYILKNFSDVEINEAGGLAAALFLLHNNQAILQLRAPVEAFQKTQR